MEEVYLKIRELRKEKGMTLKELSEMTELSVSFLSQIERGDSSLSITSLKKIADSLSVPIVYFFEEDFSEPYYKVNVEEEKPFKLNNGEQTYLRLSGNFAERKLEPVLVTLPPKMQEHIKYSHPGEEFYYVLKGQVNFYLEDECYPVYAGQTIHYPSKLHHSWENPLDIESVVISVTTPVIF